MVDLSGKWSGSLSMRDVDGYCAYAGSVSATLQQNGNAIDGQYSFSITSSTPTGKLEGLKSCTYDGPTGGTVVGSVDGTLVHLRDDSQGIELSGPATNDLLSLTFDNQFVIGNVKLQKYANSGTSQQGSGTQPSINDMVRTGVSFLNAKQFDKALDYFNKIIGQDPNNVLGWMGRGVSYVGLKDYDQAIINFKKSLEMSPNNKDILQWLGRTYYLKNYCVTASDYYDRALSVDPQNAKILSEKKIIDSCIEQQKQKTKNPPPLVGPTGKPLKETTKETPPLVGPTGKPLKETTKETTQKEESKTKPITKTDCTKILPLTLEIRKAFRDSVVESYGNNPQVQKYLNAITLIGRDSINFDSVKVFNDLDVTMGINTKYEREELDKKIRDVTEDKKLTEINDVRNAVQKMWAETDKRFMSKTGVPLECANIFVYDEYGGRPFNAPDKPEGYKQAGSIRVMLKEENFSVIPIYVDVTGKAHAGKTITSIQIGYYDINDLKQYAREFIDKIETETKAGKPVNPKYIVKVADVLQELILGRIIPEEEIKPYLDKYDLLVETARNGTKVIEKSQAIDYLTKIEKLDMGTSPAVLPQAAPQTTKSLLYENKQYGFSMKYQSSWTKKELLQTDPNSGFTSIVSFALSNNTVSGVGFSTKNDYKGLDDTKFLAKMKKQVSDACTAGAEKGIQCSDITTSTDKHKNGYKMYSVYYMATVPSSQGTVNLMEITTYIPDGNGLWSLQVFSAAPAELQQLGQDLTASFDTFTISNYKGVKSTTQSQVVSPVKTTPSVKSDFGSLQLSSDEFLVSKYAKIDATVSGQVNNFQQGLPLTLKITKPDGTTEEQKIMVTRNGDFKAPLKIGHDWPAGTYTITASVGSQEIGSISFNLVTK